MRGRKLSFLPGPGELALIARIRRLAAQNPNRGLRLGIGDDCALLQPPAGEQVTVTTDLSIAGLHFRLDWHPPEVVGHRTLARGLSDLAAMGADPIAAFLSLGLPRELTARLGRRAAWVDRFLDGFLQLAKRFDTPLAGGDLAETPLALADIVLVGSVPRGRALLRAGARAGDLVYVTGRLGGAAAGLAKLGEWAAEASHPKNGFVHIPGNRKTQLAAHLAPEPRIAQGTWLRDRATAAIDLSDGLSTDLHHICEESGVAAEIDTPQLPIHPIASLDQALHGGEDYELLFTAAASVRIPKSIAGVAITRIGRIMRRHPKRPVITLRTAKGAVPMEPGGWRHFA